MKNPFKRKLLAASIMALSSGLIMPAIAQDTPEKEQDKKSIALEEIVVTGSLIRGVEATGSQKLGIDSTAVAEIGAVTTNEILGSLPQVTNFFNNRAEEDPRGSYLNTINRPNLRNLPGFTSASGSTTLVLMDGRRIAPVGVDDSSIDPDIIPASVIERVEVVTDGGSSLYGADAVGGVINFVTKKEFDGVQLDIGSGFGDDYSSYDTALTGGTSWENGSGYLSLNKSSRDEVLNGDRDWAATGTWTANGLVPDGTECIAPVGAVTTWAHYGAGWTNHPLAASLGVKVTPVGQPCSISDQSALQPEQERDSIFGRVNQALNDSVTLDVQTYYTGRTTTFASYPLGDTISEPTPVELALPGNFRDTYDVAAVGFSYGANSAYRHREQEIDIETWGIAPELTIELDGGWQLRNSLYYGSSESTIVRPESNRPVLESYVASGLLDPTNVAAANASVISDILNWEYGGQTIQELFSARMVADGAVMDLPAGELRMAVGLELSEDRARTRTGETTIGALGAMDYREGSRDVQSFFGELSIPVIDKLDLSLSSRMDDYSDFGSTSNPNVGFNFAPLEWASIYGHWGQSFNAPTVLDSLGQSTATFHANAAQGVPDPLGARDPNRRDVLHMVGSGGDLKPQSAETWAIGFAMEPPMVEGLTLNANYYEIEFDDILGAPNPQLAQAVLLNPEKFIWNPTQEQLDFYVALLANGDQFTNLDVSKIGLILDRRIANVDTATLKGIDFAVNYQHDTDFGTLYYGLSGNYQTEFELVQNGTAVDQLAVNTSDLSISSNVGWSRDNINAKLTVKYSGAYDTDVAQLGQTEVDAFIVTDLFVGYDFDGGSYITDGLSLRFNVDNLFDEDPPIWRQNANLSYSGFTLGRVYKLGLTKKF